jgi:acylphosphatase
MSAQEPERRAVRLTITGHVQGVWFRAWAAEQAKRLGLDGWVRNRRDGSVEALVAGDAAAVQGMIEACKVGPPAARVAHVAVASDSSNVGAGFAVRPTG